MKILEVIHLRMAGDDAAHLAEFVRVAAEEAPGLPEVRTYRHARVEGDLLVHLQREASAQKIEPSELGVRLASVLRAHGMVEHSVWVGCEGHGAAAECRGRKGSGSQP